jgi:hypothetical protein
MVVTGVSIFDMRNQEHSAGVIHLTSQVEYDVFEDQGYAGTIALLM